MAASMQEVRARAALDQPVAAIVPAQRQNTEISFFDTQGFELMQRIAKGFAAASLVPKEYQGNLPNCIVALNMAKRIGADPLMVMQNLVVVHGRPTWSAQFLIATFNTCGRFSALRYEFFGDRNTDDWGCRAYATEKATGEKLVGTDVTIGIAKAEGWYARNGSKWKTMPQQMLQYRSASWFIRAHAPELSMGLHTKDEAEDAYYEAERTESGAWEVPSNDLVVEGEAAETHPIEVQPSQDDLSAGTVDTGTGEISPPSPAFADWQAAIEGCATKPELGRVVSDIRKDTRLSADEHAELLRQIGERQAALSRETGA